MQPIDANATSPPLRAVVFGGYGTFGRHVCRHLASRGISMVVAGRQLSEAQAFAASLCESLGPTAHVQAVEANVRDRSLCLSLLDASAVAVNCAGPFSQLGNALLEACLQTGCHYTDIADDRRYAACVREHGSRFRDLRLTAAYGCSSLPSISGALALVARQAAPAAATHARLTLFIGNNNPKGLAAVESAAGQMGRPIDAPQGPLPAFGDPEVAGLPPPFGSRIVLNFNCPDYDLLPALLGVASIAVKVGFELRLANRIIAALARRAPRLGRRVVPILGRYAGLIRGWGSSGGVVLAELFLVDGSVRRRAMVARQDGQRMAALPCAYVAERLCRGLDAPRGAVTAYDVLGPQPLIDALVADGFEFWQPS